VRPLNRVDLPHVVDLADLGGARKPAVDILAQRVVGPASLPQLVGDLNVLLAAPVALVMVYQPVDTEVAVGVLLEVGDDVPADPALGEVVERRDPARELDGGAWITELVKARPMFSVTPASALISTLGSLLGICRPSFTYVSQPPR
jgi:hypothetical protein